MRRAAIGGAAALGSWITIHAGQPPASPPTYAKDVAPIMFGKCAECHRPGEVAPMSLLSYQETRPWAKVIRNKVVSREMPPWHADPRYGTFRNDKTLTEQEINTIVKWVEAGAPRGDDADLPAAPKFADGWQGGEPDYVFEMPEYHVPAEGEVPNEYIWIPNPFKEDLLVGALELRPGNAAVVHHIRADAVKLPPGCEVVGGRLVGPDGKPARNPGGADDVLDAEGNRYYLVAYVPGRGLERHRPGTAKRISAGTWIRLNVHYQPNGVPTTDRSKLGIWISKARVTHEVFTRTVGQALPTDADVIRYIAEGKEIVRVKKAVMTQGSVDPGGRLPNIPPYAENWELIGITPVTEPITLYALSPHMHLRGKDLKWVLIWPDGREETLLSVPKYDFNWQLQYELAKPLNIPAGSKLLAIAHFDNSHKNPYNPSPDKEVYWAEQSWDEMFSPFAMYTVDNLNIGPPARGRQERR